MKGEWMWNEKEIGRRKFRRKFAQNWKSWQNKMHRCQRHKLFERKHASEKSILQLLDFPKTILHILLGKLITKNTRNWSNWWYIYVCVCECCNTTHVAVGRWESSLDLFYKLKYHKKNWNQNQGIFALLWHFLSRIALQRYEPSFVADPPGTLGHWDMGTVGSSGGSHICWKFDFIYLIRHY